MDGSDRVRTGEEHQRCGAVDHLRCWRLEFPLDRATNVMKFVLLCLILLSGLTCVLVSD